MKAIWDNVRGLDVLEDMEEVRAGGVGAIGHSLGGHNAIYTATFDARIAVVVSSCGFDSYQAYKDGDITGWTSSRYMPRLRDYALAAIPFDFHDMVAALAPRPFFASAPLRDDNFKWQSVDAVAAAARRVYALYGVEDRLSNRPSRLCARLFLGYARARLRTLCTVAVARRLKKVGP